MSYLLDALKQSQHADMSAEQHDLQSEQFKQHQALKRYRRLAFIFGGSLAAFITIGVGFSAGKWLQMSPLNMPTSHVDVIKDAQLSEIVPDAKVEIEAKKTEEPVAEPNSQVVPSNKATIEGQLVHVQTPNGIQQMLLTPNGQYIPMPTTAINNAPTLNQQPMVNQPYTQAMIGAANSYQQSTPAQNQNTSSTQIDMSKYKVLGKPIEDKKQADLINDPELDGVPVKLKNAFAQAVHDAENNQDYEVTQASNTSSRVDPVELLPDGLQTMLPAIKYQAHIYSSSADKRWIKLNGRELHEGESIGALTVKEITPEQSVIDFDGYEFSLKALQDWPQS